MRIIARGTLRTFWEQHLDAEQPLKAWFHNAEQAQWKTPAEVKKAYASASILANNRVVFNIKGNDYRLVVMIRYDLSIVFIRFVGSHVEYDGVDATAV